MASTASSGRCTGGGFYHPQKYLFAPPRLPDACPGSMGELTRPGAPGVRALHRPLPVQRRHLPRRPQGLRLEPGRGDRDRRSGCCSRSGSSTTRSAACSASARRASSSSRSASWSPSRSRRGLPPLFAGRAAFLLVGAMLATAMSANGLAWIIPGQRKVVAQLRAGTPVDPIHGWRAKQRSVHNTYFTLPVLVAMLSNHYGWLVEGKHNWIVLVALMLAGALIRHSFVARHKAVEGRRTGAHPCRHARDRGPRVWLAPARPVATARLPAVPDAWAPEVAPGSTTLRRLHGEALRKGRRAQSPDAAAPGAACLPSDGGAEAMRFQNATVIPTTIGRSCSAGSPPALGAMSPEQRAGRMCAAARARSPRCIPPHLPSSASDRAGASSSAPGKASAACRARSRRIGRAAVGLVVTRYGYAVPCRGRDRRSVAPGARLRRVSPPSGARLCAALRRTTSPLPSRAAARRCSSLPAGGRRRRQQDLNRALLASGPRWRDYCVVSTSRDQGGGWRRRRAIARPDSAISDVPGDWPGDIALRPPSPTRRPAPTRSTSSAVTHRDGAGSACRLESGQGSRSAGRRAPRAPRRASSPRRTRARAAAASGAPRYAVPSSADLSRVDAKDVGRRSPALRCRSPTGHPFAPPCSCSRRRDDGTCAAGPRRPNV